VCRAWCVVRGAWVGGAEHRNGGVAGHLSVPSEASFRGRLQDQPRVRLFSRRAALTDPPFFSGALRLRASTGLEPYQPYWVEDGTRVGMRVQLWHQRCCQSGVRHSGVRLRANCLGVGFDSCSRPSALVLAPQTLNPESCGEPHSALRRDNRSDYVRLSVTLSVGTPFVPTVLPAVGSMDFPLPAYSRNPFVVRYVAAQSPVQVSNHIRPFWQLLL
jgi:hypothetical protein